MAILNKEAQLALVAAARAGDQTAYAELYRIMSPIIRRSLFTMVPQDDLDDVVQNTMVRAFKKLDQFTGDSSFSTWCTRIGINTGLMHVRKLVTESRYVACSLDDTVTTDEGGELPILELGYEDRTFDQRAAHATIHQGMTLLTDVQRLVLSMRLEGYSLEDICESTGQSLSAVKSSLHHAKGTLAQVVRGERTKPVKQQRLRTRKVAAVA